MTLYANVTVAGETVHFGCGLVADLPAGVMSPERAELERQAAEREQREVDEAAALAEHDREAEAAFWAARHGEQPTYSVADALRRFDEATARADRREQALEHRADCGCETCGARLIGTGIVDVPRPRLGSLVDKEIAESQAEFMAQSATVGAVAHLAADADRKWGALARFFKGEPV